MVRRAWPALAWALLVGCGGPGGPRPTVNLESVDPVAESWEDADVDHLQHVLTPEQQAEFLELPLEERREFLRVAWAAVDPTPTTPENERRQEHYRRLAVARTEFGIEDPPGWDHRGDLLLRYGAPDSREKVTGDVVPGLGLVPPVEIWVYHWLGQAYRLVDARFQGEYIDTASANRRTSRMDLAREVADRRDHDDPYDANALRMGADDIAHLGADADGGARIDEGGFRVHDAEAQLARERLEAMLLRGQEGLSERPRAYRHDHGGVRLDLFFDTQCFSDEGSSRTRLEVNTAFWAQDLAFRPARDDSGLVAVLDTELVLTTPDYREVARAGKRTRSRRESPAALAESLVLDRVALATDPGPYRLAISVRDSVSGNVGIFRTEVDLPAFPAGILSISDLQLALDVRPVETNVPFRKGVYQVVPYPLGTFPRDRQIFLYFEVYGLALDPEDEVARYAVEFKVQPRETSSVSWFGSSRGRMVPGVATSYETSAPTRNVQEYFSLDPVTLEEDVYDVEIRVIDRIAEIEASRRVAFAVQK